MPQRIFVLFTLCLSISLLTNCGTIIHGSRQNIVIVSEPRKANIEIDGMNVGITPFTTRLKRGSPHTVRLQLEGFNDYTVELRRKLDGWILGNILFGGVIGLVVDVATGSMYRLSPNDVFAELKRNGSTAGIEKDRVYLAVTLTPKAGWEKIGQLEALPVKR